jgi:small subunit ribosomal protein S1
MAAVEHVMSEQHEAPGAPATAVEAEQGASQGAPAPTHNPDPAAEGATPRAADAAVASQPESGGAASSGEGETHAEGDGSDDGAPDGAEEGTEEGANAAPGDPQRKKRRRRRRKKPGAQPTGEGGEAAAAEGAPHAGGEREQRAPREGAGGVFARFFDGANAGKRHAFSAGEVVAGRVVRINDGAFVVDLFGKATAFVDIFEPHEVPVLPEPPPAPVATEQTEAQVAAAAAGEPPPAGDVASESSSEPTADAQASEAQGTDSAVEPSEAPTQPSADPSAPSEAAAGEAAPPAEAAPSATSVAEPSVAETASEASQGEASAAPEGEHAEHTDEATHEERAAEPEPTPPPPPELGSIFRGRIGSVSESGHVVLVNRIVDSAAAKQRIVRAREQRQRVRGVVYGFNRGGFDVLVDGVRVFCPASGMSLGPIENPESMLGQRLEFTVPPAKAGTHGLVVSRRGILERQQRKAAKQLFRSLSPGQRLRGRVTQVREFGLFVDLGGFEGLVHQSELSFSRGVRPEDVAKVGDELDVQVLRVGEGQTRKERERVSLSLKTLQADPWGDQSELLEPGNIVTGKVVRTTEFGAFIELAPQIEGLLHISELGRELKHANQALEDGQEIRVVVERVDRKARRISLSKLSAAEEKALESGTDAKSARPPKPGQHLTVVVDKVDHAGLIVQVPGVFGRRGRGFIPNSEMGTERGTDHRRGFPPGTQIPVKAIGVDRDGGFRFSRKALLVEEEKRAVQDYRREAARHGLGTFGDLLRAKLEGSKPGS